MPALLAVVVAAQVEAASGDIALGDPALVVERTDLAVAGVGDIGARSIDGGGAGELLLEGVGGEVTRALLYWHGIDLTWATEGFTGGNADYDEADIVFAGQPVTGTRLAGKGYNNNWGDGAAQDPATFSAALYRADVTHLVSGSGSYTLAGLADGAGHSANGASLVVFHDDGNAFNDVRVEHYEAMDSNLDAVFQHWPMVLPLAYVGGKVELVLHVADGQASMADGDHIVHVYPGLLPGESTRFDFGSPQTDGEPLWAGRSVPRMGFPRPSPGIGLWDIRRFDLTPAFHRPGEHAIYGYGQDGPDFLTLVLMQLVQSAPGQPLALAPGDHDFGDHALATSSPVQQFTLLNRQNAAISVGTVNRGSIVFALVGDACTGAVLAPGGTCTVDVQCTPTALRDYAASLTIAWTDAFGADHQSLARMHCAGTTTAEHARLRIDPQQAWFGAHPAGSSAGLRRFTVGSLGTEAATVEEIVRAGTHASSFVKEADTCTGSTLAPGETCSFDLRFRPPAGRTPGSLSATVDVEFSSSAAMHLPQPVPIAGTVLPDLDGIFKDGFESP